MPLTFPDLDLAAYLTMLYFRTVARFDVNSVYNQAVVVSGYHKWCLYLDFNFLEYLTERMAAACPLLQPDEQLAADFEVCCSVIYY